MIEINLIRFIFHLVLLILALLGAYFSYKLYRNVTRKPKESLIIAFSLASREIKFETKLVIFSFIFIVFGMCFYILEKIYPTILYFVVFRGILSLLFAIAVIYVFIRWVNRLEKIGKEWI